MSSATRLGIARAHGATGAFVSEWVFDKTTLEVKSGNDLIQNVFTYDAISNSYVEHNAALGNGVAFNRFCSADLADQSAFYNSATGLGYNGGRLFLNGEESGVEGRAFAHVVGGAQDGNSYELAWLGNMAFENVVANAHTGNKTVVAVTDDGQNGQVYFYAGDKKATGNAVEQAGLTGGHLFGIHVTDLEGLTNNEFERRFPAWRRRTVDVHDGQSRRRERHDRRSDRRRERSGRRDLVPASGRRRVGHGQSQPLLLCDDQRLRPAEPAVGGGLHRRQQPGRGGTIKLLLNGTEGQQMFDNITVNAQGKIILQEDVGNNAHIGKVWQYDPSTDSLSRTCTPRSEPLPLGRRELPHPGRRSHPASSTFRISSAMPAKTSTSPTSRLTTSISGELVQGGQLELIHQYLV